MKIKGNESNKNLNLEEKDMLNYQRYKRVPVIDYPERQWPYKEIEKAPIWCSVDLRDGNQALIEPMVVEEKIEMFNLLVKLGFMFHKCRLLNSRQDAAI